MIVRQCSCDHIQLVVDEHSFCRECGRRGHWLPPDLDEPVVKMLADIDMVLEVPGALELIEDSS